MPDPAYASWLQEAQRLLTKQVAGGAAWGDVAQVVSMASGIDGQADAGAVADTVAAFYAGTMVEELVTIPGIVDVNALTGLVITINCPAHAAYAAREVFVLGGGVEHAVGITQLNVLRRL